MNPRTTNRILIYTLIAITLIAVYTAVNSYYREVKIYQNEELFKLDCIANAVAYKISGEEHNNLVYRYPSSTFADSVLTDSTYKKIHEQMAMAKMMTKVPSEMFTVVRDTNKTKYYFAIGTDRNDWLLELNQQAALLDSMYEKGGPVGIYNTPDGVRLSAISPVMNSAGEIVSVLQVEETFDSFLAKARSQIYINILVSVFFISIIGILMFFSVKAILKRQEKLAIERQDMEKLRQELVSNVSHDLRTPLASIHGYIETLIMKRDSLDSEQQLKYLNTSLQSTEKLKVLMDELFEFSKLQSKENPLNIERFGINELVFDVVNHFKISALEKNVKIETEIPNTLPLVHGDVALIDRVLQNIIGNSIKFSDPNDSIKIKLNQFGNKVWVVIEDTGLGISSDELPHVFDRFHKGKSPRAGSGLGLAIAKTILDRHKSEYSLESKLGEGTKFSFSLNT